MCVCVCVCVCIYTPGVDWDNFFTRKMHFSTKTNKMHFSTKTNYLFTLCTQAESLRCSNIHIIICISHNESGTLPNACCRNTGGGAGGGGHSPQHFTNKKI